MSLIIGLGVPCHNDSELTENSISTFAHCDFTFVSKSALQYGTETAEKPGVKGSFVASEKHCNLMPPYWIPHCMLQ